MIKTDAELIDAYKKAEAEWKKSLKARAEAERVECEKREAMGVIQSEYWARR